VRSPRERISQTLRWCLVLVGIVGFCAGVVMLVSGFRQTRMIIFGHAEDYRQLEQVTEVERYLEFFPQTGRRFYYWCRPYQADVCGTYEISERDFVEWAKSKGWGLQEACGRFDSFDIPQPDKSHAWVELKDGLFHQERVPKKPEFLEPHNGILESALDVYFDRAEGRTYFRSIAGD
jgi:hypothetical protein